MARAWVIYYDTQEIRSDACALEEVPCDGVIVLAQADEEVGRELLHRKDYYYWEHGRWYGADRYGMEDYLRRPGWKKIVAGRNTSPALYHSLMDLARLDTYLPSKSARLVGEDDA